MGNLLSDTNFMGVWTVISSPSISQSSDVKTVNCVSPNFPLPTTKDALVKRAKAADASPAVGGLRPSVVVWINEPKWTPNDNWVVGVADMGTIVPDWFVFGGRSSPQEDLGLSCHPQVG